MLNSINVSLVNKQLISIYYPKNKNLCFKMLKLLYNEGYILSYLYNINTNKILVYLNYYKGKSMIGGISSFNKSSFPVYIKYTDLITIFKYGTSVLILSTVKGFIPHYLALKYKVGGKAICLLK